MKIQIDNRLDNVKDLKELTRLLSRTLEKLQSDLQSQPEFLVITADDQEVPESTPVNTIVFRLHKTAIVKTGYFNGDEIILP